MTAETSNARGETYTLDMIEDAWGDAVPLTKPYFDRFRARLEALRKSAAQPPAAEGVQAGEAEQRARELLEAECGRPLPLDVPVCAAHSAVVAALPRPAEHRAQPKRRPYNASGSLSEYGVFPECDAQQPAAIDQARGKAGQEAGE